MQNYATDGTGACPGCENERSQVFEVSGLDCATEVALVEGRLRRLAGVCSARASAATGKATVVHTLDDRAIEAALAEVGLKARPARTAGAARARGSATLSSALLTIGAFLASGTRQDLSTALFAAAILAGGLPVARKGLARARHGTLDMNALMSVAVVGAMLLGDWAEGASTVALFSLAQLLEARSLERARREVAGLLAQSPELARVRRATSEQHVRPESVATGETVLVAPGERVSFDGVVIEGTSDVDQSPLTGESRPVERSPGQGLLAGSINGSGLLAMRVTRRAAETTLARILLRVEEAQASRAPSQGLVDRFARVYTPIVVALAVLLTVLPPLLGLLPLQASLERALVLLVIACPCALVLSTPISFVCALTAASRAGVLIKGGAHLEALARLRVAAFDKTGTLTSGQPSVSQVWAAPGESIEAVVADAAALERHAGHPLASAVVARAAASGLRVPAAGDVTALPGRGMSGRVEGREVLVGSHRLFDERGLCDHALDGELRQLEAAGKTVVLVGGAGVGVRGFLAADDSLRPEAPEAMRQLREAGLELVMLTGDNRTTADAVARSVGIVEWHAELLPDDKLAQVQAQRRRGAVAMVGDGVNDAPALAASDVGVAMGPRGTDAALETADVVLMAGDLRRLPWAVALGRVTRRIVWQNVILSLAVKGVVLALALAGYASLWAAVAADMGSSLLVISNGLRLLRRRP